MLSPSASSSTAVQPSTSIATTSVPVQARVRSRSHSQSLSQNPLGVGVGIGIPISGYSPPEFTSPASPSILSPASLGTSLRAFSLSGVVGGAGGAEAEPKTTPWNGAAEEAAPPFHPSSLILGTSPTSTDSSGVSRNGSFATSNNSTANTLSTSAGTTNSDQKINTLSTSPELSPILSTLSPSSPPPPSSSNFSDKGLSSFGTKNKPAGAAAGTAAGAAAVDSTVVSTQQDGFSDGGTLSKKGLKNVVSTPSPPVRMASIKKEKDKTVKHLAIHEDDENESALDDGDDEDEVSLNGGGGGGEGGGGSGGTRFGQGVESSKGGLTSILLPNTSSLGKGGVVRRPSRDSRETRSAATTNTVAASHQSVNFGRRTSNPPVSSAVADALFANGARWGFPQGPFGNSNSESIESNTTTTTLQSSTNGLHPASVTFADLPSSPLSSTQSTAKEGFGILSNSSIPSHPSMHHRRASMNSPTSPILSGSSVGKAGGGGGPNVNTTNGYVPLGRVVSIGSANVSSSSSSSTSTSNNSMTRGKAGEGWGIFRRLSIGGTSAGKIGNASVGGSNPAKPPSPPLPPPPPATSNSFSVPKMNSGGVGMGTGGVGGGDERESRSTTTTTTARKLSMGGGGVQKPKRKISPMGERMLRDFH